MAIESKIIIQFKEFFSEDYDFLNFLRATINGNLELVKSFIEANPHKINCFDTTFKARASHLAAKYNQPEILQFLIDNGAEIGSKTNEDLSEIHYGINFPEVVKIIINHNPDLKNQRGQGFIPKEICSNEDSLNYICSTKRMRSDSSIERMFASAFIDESEEAFKAISPSSSPTKIEHSNLSSANKIRRIA